MNASIRILHLEPEPADTERVRTTVAEAGIDCRITRVGTRDEFHAAIQKRGYDIVLAEIRPPLCDGMTVLRMVREQFPDVPFIFFSDAAGDTTAIEALTHGAVDFVPKKNIWRLSPAIKRALREAENRRERVRIEAELHRRRTLLRCLMDASSDLIFIKDKNSVYQGCNKASEEFLGIPEREQIGKTDFDFFEREKAEAVRTDDGKVLATGKPLRTEEWVTRRDGEPVLMDTLKTPCYGPDGEILGLVGIGRDITERWWAEETRRTKLRFFECMDKVNRTIQEASDLDRMMSEVLDVVLTTFDCDRVSLVYPCEPTAASWQVLMERTKPEYPLAVAPGGEVATDSETARVYQTLLASDGPVQFHPLAEHPLPTATAERLNEQSRLAVTIYPKGDKPYMFAAHQCAYPRVWTAADERLFLMIGHRLTDGLASLRAFRELRESEARYRRIVDTASEGVWLLGPDHMTVLVNARMADLIGYPVEELIGRPLTDFMFKEDEQDHIRKMDARRQGTSEHYERRLRRKDGQTVWTLASATPLFDDDRRFSGSFAMFTDITALKRNNAINASRLHLMQFAATHALDDLLEETLNEAEKLTGSRIGFYHFVEDDQESLTLQNWSTRTKTQFCKAEGKGLHYPISYAGVWVDCIDRRGPVIHNDYASLAHRKGTPEGHAEVIRELVVPVLRGQRIKAILGVGNKPVDYRQQDVETISLLADLAWEIAERKLAEEALRAQQDFIRNILDSVDEGFIVVDAKYRIRSANRAFLNMVDSTEERVVGRCCYEISHRATHPCFESGEACPVRQTFETSTTQFVTHLHRHASGTKQYVELKAYPITDASGAVVSVIETLNDVTEKRKLEEQLIQSRKMESVGRLAGGVAHDFNNMLGVITGHTELALGQVEPDNPLFAHLQEIFNAARRSADLTRQLLAFARKQVVAPKVLDLNRTVEGMLKMLRRLIGENIALAWLPGPDVWPVKVDPAQIDQILVNLCVNARDAVAGAGKITIETGNSAFDDAYCVDHPGFMPGDFLLLAVSDDGLGMEVKTLDKIFEPFFTTKARGKGTGLGLATVYGIVKQNAGFINVYSEPEHGTTFRIYLPRHATEAEQPVKISPAPPLMQGSETILLVEDEPAILDLTQLMLKRLGYRVLTASTPGDALRIARQYDGDIHLLITDVVMPGMNGWQLAKNLLSLYPEVRYLFMSGYTGNVIAHHGVLDEGVNFIQKPFSLQRLAATVRQALDGK